MDITVKAARMRSILDDEVFKGLINEAKQDQINVFLHPASSLDKIEEARLLVRAIEDLLTRMNNVCVDGQIFERKHKKRKK